MAKKMKKLLSVVVALCICVSVLPLQALAVTETETSMEVSPEGFNTQVTTTTTTETDEDGKTTVTVTIEKDTAGTTEEGVEVERKETETNTTITEENGAVTEQSKTEGSEKKEWTEEIKPGEEVPDVVAKWEPGTEEPIKGEVSESTPEGEINSEAGKTTTTVDRTVNVEISKVEVKVEDSNGGMVEDKEIKLEGLAPVYDTIDGVKQDKGGMFDSQFNSGLNSKYADPSKWTGANAMPDDADLRFLGTGEHTTYYAAIVYVVYEKDENGNAKKDENGEYIIEKLWRYNPATHDPETHSKQQQLTINGEDATELPEDIYGLPEYDNSLQTGGNRPTVHAMMDEYGNIVYGYCIDNMQDTKAGAWYKISNLEDSDYYASEDAENHVRNIVKNGYWGTTNIADENGEFATGSVEKLKENLKQAIKDGKLSDELVLPETNEDGTPKLDEDGNPVYKTWSMTEVIDDLTAGEAMIATQAAIWSYSNGSIAAQNGKDGYLIIDPDQHANHKAGSSKPNADILDDFGGARIDLLYTWLINLEEEEESTVIINDKNFVEDMSLVVHEKDAEHANNQDDDQDNDVYNTDLNFKLAFIPGEKDDLLVQITYIDLDGNPVNLIRRLAGKNAEDQNYEDIKPEADGSYVLKGLKLSENEDFAFDLRLEGTQYLENAVYVYEAVGGRTASQNFVGLAEGERNVDVSAGMTISFEVDEEKNIVAERVWHSESDPIYTPGEEPEDTTTIPDTRVPYSPEPVEQRLVNDEAVTIEDEEVPLADTPETGDMTALWIGIIVAATVSLCAFNAFAKKRQQNVF